MATLAQIEANIAKLQQSLAGGKASVEYEGRRITYHSPSEILQAIAYFEGERKKGASSPVPSQSFAQFTRG